MSKILKNTTGSIVFIADVGQSVPASGQLTIDTSDYDKYAGSSDTVVYIGNGTLVVNDGSFDLNISDGVDLIKGLFPSAVEINNSALNGVYTRYVPSSLDSFGRLRVSNPQTIFENSFSLDKSPFLWDESVSGGGTATHNANKSSVELATPTTSGAKAFFQTKKTFRYHPGKSHLFIISGNLGGLKENCRRRIGYFTTSDGVFFELDGTQLRCVVRSSVSGSIVDTQINQANWNVDKLDGTGVTGITLDPTKQQIFFVDIQWLGSGAIRFGTIINGDIHYAHIVYNSNVLTDPWCKFPYFPIRAEIENTGTTASTTTAHITCVTVISEGGWGPEGIIRTISNGSTPRSFGSAGSIVPLISIRKQTAYANIPLHVFDVGVFANSADDFLVTLVLNGTLTGASWANVSGIAQKDVAATSITGGTELYSSYLRGSSSSASRELTSVLQNILNTILGADFSGASEIFSLVAMNITSSATASGFINYKELI